MQTLYRMYGADGRLLYVGISATPSSRFVRHRQEKEWWSEIARIDLEHHGSRQQVMDAERAAIEREHPKYNQSVGQRFHSMPEGLMDRILVALPALPTNATRTDGWTLADICRAVGAPNATEYGVRRALTALRQDGKVVRCGSRYSTTCRYSYFGDRIEPGSFHRALAQPGQ